jgi:hypothetical protein
MAELEELDLDGCSSLEAMPLPVSSDACARQLTAQFTLLARLPEGMRALEFVDVLRCSNLAGGELDGWLPASSAARLHTLHAEHSNLRSVPAGTTVLRDLWMAGSGCPASSIPPAVLCLLEILDGHARDHAI